MDLKQLAIDHDFYSSPSNYYSGDACGHYATFADFYAEFYKADVDLNLIFRWDIYEADKPGKYYCEIFMIHQRKGIYMPIHIDSIEQNDVPNFIKLVSKHWKKLTSIWSPISGMNNLKIKSSNK